MAYSTRSECTEGGGSCKTGYIDLLYLRSRWYAVQVGRFTTPDTIVPDFSRPQSINEFAYAFGNPLKYVDPAGFFASGSVIENIREAMCHGERDGCEIHEVVTFIVEKIHKDAASCEIREIRGLNETHYHEDAWIACQRMPWWQRLLLCPYYLRSAMEMDEAARIAASTRFGCLVAPYIYRPVCGQWDYKEDIARDWGYRQEIDFCSIGIDEKVTFYYDIWANFHFGYVGTAGGFSEESLLTGAAIEHAVHNLGQIQDDPSDKACYVIGIGLYDSPLTEKVLLRQIYLHKHELNKVRRNERGEWEVYR